jgi:voltage-gated potassium channel
MSGVTKHNNFIFLTIALVALLLVSAVGHSLHSGLGIYFGQIMTLATLSVTYHTLNFGPRWRRFVGVTLVLCLAVAAAGVINDTPEVRLTYRIIALVFFIGTTVVCSHQVLFADTTGTNAILATLSIYLLLGLIWATLYMITLYFVPGAFKGITHVPEVDTFPRILYFSYVTLATLGYGDISPAAPMSRTLAYLEAVAGTFYLAIVVASLIGSRLKK